MSKYWHPSSSMAATHPYRPHYVCIYTTADSLVLRSKLLTRPSLQSRTARPSVRAQLSIDPADPGLPFARARSIVELSSFQHPRRWTMRTLSAGAMSRLAGTLPRARRT